MQPIISKGFGALTPETWRRIIAAVTVVENSRGALDNKKSASSSVQPLLPEFFLAKITGNAVLLTESGYPIRYKYSWARIQIEGAFASLSLSGDFNQLIGSTTNSTTSTWAINVNEIGNTATFQNGYAIDAGTNELAIAAGFSVAPITTGQCVEMRTIRLQTSTGGADGGRAQFIFSCVNPIIGDCA